MIVIRSPHRGPTGEEQLEKALEHQTQLAAARERDADQLRAKLHAVQRAFEVVRPRYDPDRLRRNLAELVGEAVADLKSAEAERDELRTDMRRKLGNQIGPTIFKSRDLLCSSCSGKGTGLTCSSCDEGVADERDTLRVERDGLREAAAELLEVAVLRGDNELPHPADEDKLWTARMQTAWDELDAALAAKGEWES